MSRYKEGVEAGIKFGKKEGLVIALELAMDNCKQCLPNGDIIEYRPIEIARKIKAELAKLSGKVKK
ncbi:hypothetical protein IID24_03355 [Patescibacteria group bacterium]|nr:hypothetical protein [Patescibacteria group bacterium]